MTLLSSVRRTEVVCEVFSFLFLQFSWIGLLWETSEQAVLLHILDLELSLELDENDFEILASKF